MTPFDDDDLIARLQSEMAERRSGISAPNGIGDDARRAARRRTATSAVSAGVPVLAAAGAATVLALASGSGSAGASGPSAGGSALSAPSGPAKAEDTAYIVKRVKAKIAAEVSQGNTIEQDDTYFSGAVSSDGMIVDLGSKSYESFQYIAPDGAEYGHYAAYNTDGSTRLTDSFVDGPVVNGKLPFSETSINNTNRTYSQMQADYSVPGKGKAPARPNSPSQVKRALQALGTGDQVTPSQVREALQGGQVTQMGTPILNGTQAIALSVKVAEPQNSAPSAPHYQSILYVDPQTYQPVGIAFVPVNTLARKAGLDVIYWVPATPDNIAQAKDDSIPAGYTKVSNPVSGGNSGSGTSGNSGNPGAG